MLSKYAKFQNLVPFRSKTAKMFLWYINNRKDDHFAKKIGLTRQVTSSKRFHSYEIFYDRTRKCEPLNTGDSLIEVKAWTCLTVLFLHNTLANNI